MSLPLCHIDLCQGKIWIGQLTCLSGTAHQSLVDIVYLGTTLMTIVVVRLLQLYIVRSPLCIVFLTMCAHKTLLIEGTELQPIEA